jgi:hypothetical protein
MKLLAAVSIGVFSLLLIFFMCLQAYKGPFLESPAMEVWRKTIDTKLRSASSRQYLQWIPNVLFHNQDKYVWHPPRILPVYENGKIVRYQVYGMVTSWNPVGKLLTLNSYIGRTIFVQFDPKPGKGPFVIVNLFDQFGQTINGSVPLVRSARDPEYNTLFCPHDIVAIEAATSNVFLRSSEGSPLVPSGIIVYNRLCKPNP